MDRRTRWETEALRSGPSQRTAPPRPTAKRTRRIPDDRPWVTLREAEAATGIPVNTLRKWVRRAGLPSYLESDGETPVRMVDLDAVKQRATELGRELEPVAPEPRSSGAPEPTDARTGDPRSESRDPRPETRDPETMLVPVDAWNKMLAQLGNLHEAGQQLAEARERAAKAETEAEFLRRRLAEIRDDDPDGSEPPEPLPAEDAPEPIDAPESPEASGEHATDGETTSYWRYLTVGWRNRRRRSAD